MFDSHPQFSPIPLIGNLCFKKLHTAESAKQKIPKTAARRPANMQNSS